MVWRRLRPGELDHELIWLSVSLAAAGAAWFWLASGLPLPRCTWHTLTGFACPSCGATRCLRWLCRGDLRSALLINPLVFFSLLAIALYDFYATIVVVFRLPRLRVDHLSARATTLLRGGAAAALLGNWAWLIIRGI